VTRPLVVWGAYINGKNRVIIAAITKKEAYQGMKAAGWWGSYPLWTKYACETRNATEVQRAQAQPGVAIVEPV
jgi:hypothetical protein